MAPTDLNAIKLLTAEAADVDPKRGLDSSWTSVDLEVNIELLSTYILGSLHIYSHITYALIGNSLDFHLNFARHPYSCRRVHARLVTSY